jgi:hypothetical protein
MQIRRYNENSYPVRFYTAVMLSLFCFFTIKLKESAVKVFWTMHVELFQSHSWFAFLYHVHSLNNSKAVKGSFSFFTYITATFTQQLLLHEALTTKVCTYIVFFDSELEVKQYVWRWKP